MNLAYLRKLVEETQHLPSDTLLVTAAAGQTFDVVRGIKPVTVLEFQQPSSECPLGSVHHKPQDPLVFGYRSEAELHEKARPMTALEVF